MFLVWLHSVIEQLNILFQSSKNRAYSQELIVSVYHIAYRGIFLDFNYLISKTMYRGV